MEKRTLIRHLGFAVALSIFSLIGITIPANARITSIAITKKTSPTFDAHGIS